jgi:hypothetical protein
MKKVFALVAVAAFAVAFTACGGKKVEEASAVDSVATEMPVVIDSVATDSTEVADSSATVIQ